MAIASGSDLPSRVRGSALDADLSGFTALTEGLASELGEQRGAEELARRLNVIYDGLICAVHAYGGAVLGFAGDAFSAWFDSDDGRRAAACGQALQRWMDRHAAAAGDGMPAPRLKVAVATGDTHRFLVGDPAVQVIEGIAGALVDELAATGHDCLPGEVRLAPSAQESLGARATTDARGVLVELHRTVAPAPWPAISEPAEQADVVRPWLLGPVFDRLAAGEGEFVADLRPATALFLRMAGIRYDADPQALERLDGFVRQVQGVLTRYEATLIQLTIGDKGSYLYAAFGAPVAHEDDQTRALLAALDLRRLGGGDGLVDEVSIGVASGRLRAGSYGGSQRRTYGVLGDTVNLAARLMQAAGPGEVVCTRALRDHVASGFEWDDLADLSVKGKAEPIAVARLVGQRAVVPRQRRPPRSQPEPMVGRVAELAALTAALDRAVAGQGAVLGVVAEAGMGKSRLVAELERAVIERGISLHHAECPSFGLTGSYVVWRPVWQRLLAVDDGMPAAAVGAAVSSRLAAVDPVLAARAPLLAPLLGAEIADNDLTRSLDPPVRKTSLEATLVTWLRTSLRGPVVIVLEDCHWIDPLSEDLLDVVGRAVRDLPVLVVVTQRPRSDTEGGELGVTRLAHYRPVPLDRLDDDEIEQLIRRRLRDIELPGTVADEISRLGGRAEGNPFYAEELIDWIVELGPGAADPARLAELPSTLQSLVLSRIDRLADRPRSTLKVASAIGRVFAVDQLGPVHPELGSVAEVAGSVALLERSDFVCAEPGAEASFGFRHAITHEVAYSTIVSQTRAVLHGRIGRLLEERAGDDTDQVLDLLAHHFARSDDDDRRRQYVLLAADGAQRRSANRAAADGYRNVLPLLAGERRLDVLLKLGRVLSLLGRLDEAAAAFAEAQDGATGLGDVVLRARAVTELGELSRKQGRYDEALARFDDARAALDDAGDRAGVAEVLHLSATVAAQRGETSQAREWFELSLAIRRELGDRRGVARALNGLGIVAEYQNDLPRAIGDYIDALAILVELDDRWAIAALTNNTGYATLLQGHAAQALPYFEQAVSLQREIGDPSMLANFLSNLGDAARELDDLPRAMRCYDESLRLARELGERWLVCYLLEDVAVLAARADDPVRAVRLAAAGARLRAEIGAPLPADSQRVLDERLGAARASLSATELAVAERSGASLGMDESVDEALNIPAR